jgi:hypothetical protein
MEEPEPDSGYDAIELDWAGLGLDENWTGLDWTAKRANKEIAMNRIAAIALLAVAGFTTGSCAKAQGAVMEVNVPFNFTVNDTLLPAGSYTFGFDRMHPDLLLIRDRTTEIRARDLGQRGAIGPGKTHALIFHGYDGVYFLSEIRFDSASNGVFLPATKAERQARKANQNEDLASIAAY